MTGGDLSQRDERPELGDGADDALRDLRNAVRDLQRATGPDAEMALARAAEVLRQLEVAMGERSGVDAGALAVFSRLCPVHEMRFIDGGLVGTVTFPDVSPEGNAWVDAGSMTAMFHQVLTGLAHRLGLDRPAASISVDFLAVTPRRRTLSITARAEQGDGSEMCLSASLADGTEIVAEARGRFVSV